MPTFERLVPDKPTHHVYWSVLCSFHFSFLKYHRPRYKRAVVFQMTFQNYILVWQLLYSDCITLHPHPLHAPPSLPPPPPNYLGNVFISVDFSLSKTLLVKTNKRFSWKIFWISRAWYKEQSVKGWSDTLSPWMQFLSFCQGNPCLLATLREADQWIFMNFLESLDMRQATIWNIFGVLRLTPWVQNLFILWISVC